MPLALGQLGCTEQACIQWGADEGPCPPREEAIKYMVPSDTCTGIGKVVSVDSEGDFDGQACCYDVTNRDENEGSSGVCSTGVTGATVGAATVASSSSTGSGPPACDAVSCTLDCSPSFTTPSNGSCVTIDNITVFCNPVTNEGCSSPNGETCDLFVSGSTTLLACQFTSFASECSFCSASGQCNEGLSCVGNAGCATFCCEDIDCCDPSVDPGCTGACYKDQYAALGLTVGVCVEGLGGSGGMGGAGGAGGAGGTGGI